MKTDTAMSQWFLYAVGAAILYGLHQVFTKMAADRIGDGLGGFVVEGTAALSILFYLVLLRASGHWNQNYSGTGIFYSALTGICVGAGTILFFLLFQKGGRCRRCQWCWREAWRSWPSLAFSFSRNRHRGRDCSALFCHSSDCFCYAHPQRNEL